MRKLRLRDERDEYRHDLDRIIQIARSRGFDLDRETARKAWEAYSGSMAAGWMSLDEDDDAVWSSVSHHLVEDED